MSFGRIAFVDAFQKLPEAAPHGTNHAAYASCVGLARFGNFEGIDLFIEGAVQIEMKGLEAAALALPKRIPVKTFDISELPYCTAQYLAIYSPGTVWGRRSPYVLRPLNDTAPVVCEVDCSHHRMQWSEMLLSLLCETARPTDGLIFKSKATQRAHQRVWESWREQFRISAPIPKSIVSPNPVEIAENKASPELRKKIRAMLQISDRQVAFLTFNRIEPFTKGDAGSLLVAWSRIVSDCPDSILIMCGALSGGNRQYLESLRTLARDLGISRCVIFLENPYELFGNARNALMSAADVFLHLSTGVEESCPLTVFEAMAHGLPPLVAGWSGMVEQVEEGVTGFVVPLIYSAAPETHVRGFWGRELVSSYVLGSQMAVVNASVLVDRVKALSQNARLRRTLGAAAHKFVQKSRRIDATAKARAEFVIELATEAKRFPIGNKLVVPVHLDHVVSELAYGLSLSPTTNIHQTGNGAESKLDLWFAPRFLPTARAILHHVASGPKPLLQIITEIIKQFGSSTGISGRAAWDHEFGKQIRFIVLRLLATGFLDVERDSANSSAKGTLDFSKQPRRKTKTSSFR